MRYNSLVQQIIKSDGFVAVASINKDALQFDKFVGKIRQIKVAVASINKDALQFIVAFRGRL